MVALMLTFLPNDSSHVAKLISSLLATLQALPPPRREAVRGFWVEFVIRVAGAMFVPLQAVLDLVPNLGKKGHLITDLITRVNGRRLTRAGWVAVLRKCLQDSFQAAAAGQAAAAHPAAQRTPPHGPRAVLRGAGFPAPAAQLRPALVKSGTLQCC